MLFKLTFSILLMVLFTGRVNAQTETLIPFASAWKYLDNGTDQKAAWREISFNDLYWNTGNGKFGYGISDANTVISYGPNAKKKYITAYFRKVITIASTIGSTSYTAKVKHDDGIVVYVNGVEVYRDNMPSGTVSYLSTASTDSKDNGNISYSFNIDASAFVIGGSNVIAVEVHQQRANNPDMAFDLELTAGTAAPPVNQPPTVSISNPANGTSYTLGQIITIAASANDPEGALAKVEFFANGVSLDQDITSPYSISWSPPNSGTYTLTAKATDGAGNSTTSTGVSINILAPPPADLTPPGVVSINRQNPTTSTTRATSVIFRATFSEKVTGVDVTDFSLTTLYGTVSGTIASVVATHTDGTSYDVSITSISGEGGIRLDLNSTGTGITDVAGNFIQTGYTAGESYIIEQSSTTPSQLFSFKSPWKYLDNGTDQGTVWRAPTFNDANWSSGNGEFGYGDGDESTIVSFGGNAKKKYITTYFRKLVSITDAAAYTYYTANVIRDDGVVVYMNGVEVFRSNMPSAGTVYYTTLASNNSYETVNFTIDASAFKTGPNVVAVELHQESQNTSDASFDMELTGQTGPPPVPQPEVLYYEGFESGTGFAGMHMQTSTSYGFTVASAPTYNDNKVGRWELRAGDPPAANGTRTEVLFSTELAQQETWHSYAGYFPSEDYLIDYDNEVFNQWHQGGSFGTPMLTFSTVNGRFEVRRRSADGSTNTYYSLGPVIYDEWVEIVIRLKQHMTNGAMQIWINGELRLNLEGGATMFDGPYGRWKMGIYKSDWNNGGTTNTTKRVWYVDEVKIGNSVCTYDMMKPAGNNITMLARQVESSSSLVMNAQEAKPDQENQIEVYPTVAKRGSFITIRTDNPVTSEAFMIDVTGRILKTTRFSTTTSVDTKDLPAGIYFINLSGNEQLKKQKIIIVD